MTDLAARREARKKHILENSENRLKKITGKNSETIIKVDKVNFQEEQNEKLVTQLKVFGDEITGEPSKKKNCKKLEEIPSCAVAQSFRYVIILNYVSTPIFNIFLALCINILLWINEDYFRYQGFILPYLIMVLTKWFFDQESDASQNKSIVIAALILCNIKSEIVHMLEKISIGSSQISKNFAIFFTSFVCFNLVIHNFIGINLLHISFF